MHKTLDRTIVTSQLTDSKKHNLAEVR